MHMRTGVAVLSLVTMCALAPRAARAEKITIDEDTFVNLGVLIQPQLQLAQDAAPDGGWTSDLFIRRGRIILAGQVDANIGFVFITDESNYGKANDIAAQFFIQDALAYYKFSPELQIDAGFMLLPFTRNNYVSAGALHNIDFHTPVIKFPFNRAFRDFGVEARGLLAQDRLYYRAGIFNGVASRKAEDKPEGPVTELNGSDAPRFTGTVRYNIAGKEDAYALPSIYFAKEPVISVGVGVDWQHDAYGEHTDHLGVNADVFAEYPLDPDNELVAAAAILHYDDYLPTGAGATPEAANAFFVEAGYRIQYIEPIVAYEFFAGEKTLNQSTLRLGVNFWISQHKYNVKAEVAVPFNETAPGKDANHDVLATVQSQVSF
jgi:Phosphate-selective porin O and P